MGSLADKAQRQTWRRLDNLIGTCFFVPALKINILFVAQMGKKRMQIYFKDGRALVIDQENKVIMTAFHEGRLYQVAQEVQYAKVTCVQEVDSLHKTRSHAYSSKQKASCRAFSTKV